MIITKTPFRISFFGGGTDYPDWVSKNGGKVLTTTIDKYCYISVRILPPFFKHKHRIVYSHIENVNNILCSSFATPISSTSILWIFVWIFRLITDNIVLVLTLGFQLNDNLLKNLNSDAEILPHIEQI